MPQFSSDWFSMHIPIWSEVVLPALPSGPCRCLEIGTHEGRSAIWILQNIVDLFPGGYLQCVDPLPDEVYEVWLQNMQSLPRFPIVSLCRLPFEEWYGQRRVVLGAGLERFQFIYVDGDHHASSVMVDTCLSFKLLCPGGVMVMDDFLWRDRSWPDQKQPGRGIEAFLSAHVGEYTLLHRGYQVIIKKT